MKTLFGIRSSVAIVAVGALYLIISLHISIHEIGYFQRYKSVASDDLPNGYLLIDTNEDSFHIISLILSLSCLFSSILLILGILEERHGIIRPWLLFNFVLKTIFISILIYFSLLFVDVYKSSSWFNACGLLVLIFFASVAAAYHIYLWNGIYCLYNIYQRRSLHFYRVPDDEDSEAVHTV